MSWGPLGRPHSADPPQGPWAIGPGSEPTEWKGKELGRHAAAPQESSLGSKADTVVGVLASPGQGRSGAWLCGQGLRGWLQEGQSRARGLGRPSRLAGSCGLLGGSLHPRLAQHSEGGAKRRRHRSPECGSDPRLSSPAEIRSPLPHPEQPHPEHPTGPGRSVTARPWRHPVQRQQTSWCPAWGTTTRQHPEGWAGPGALGPQCLGKWHLPGPGLPSPSLWSQGPAPALTQLERSRLGVWGHFTPR